MVPIRFYIIGPTESILTKRGNRFPDFAGFLHNKGISIRYYTSDFYHAEKRRFTKEEIKNAKAFCSYELNVSYVIGYSGNITVRRVISNFLFSLMIFCKLLFLVRKKDAIMIPSRPVELIFFISLIHQIIGCKIYIDVQDIWPDALQIKSRIKKQFFSFYCNLFLRRSLKRYTFAFITAPSFINWLHRYSANIPFIFLPLGWENSRWECSPIDDLYESSLDKYEIKLVCVAQLQHQIDIMPILTFLKDNKNYHLTIIGEDGKGERYPEVIRFIERNRIENISITGIVQRMDMLKYLKNKDIGIIPMITTSIPNKIFDYLGAKLPIIVLGKNDSSDFVNKYDIGWSCNFDAESCESLIIGITWEDIYKKKNNVEKVRNQFSRFYIHNELLTTILDVQSTS